MDFAHVMNLVQTVSGIVMGLVSVYKSFSALGFMRAGMQAMRSPCTDGMHLHAATAAYTGALCEWAQVLAASVVVAAVIVAK